MPRMPRASLRISGPRVLATVGVLCAAWVVANPAAGIGADRPAASERPTTGKAAADAGTPPTTEGGADAASAKRIRPLGGRGDAEERTTPVILEPRAQTTKASEIASTVLRVHRELGQSFKKGDLLIELDRAIFEANLVRAEAGVSFAEAEYERKKRLLRGGTGAPHEVESARFAFEDAKAKLAVAKKQVESCSILAPYDGRVADTLINQYETVQAGAPLIRLVDDSVLRAKFLVPSRLINRVEIDMKVTLTIRETEQTVTGAISHIDAAINPASQTFRVMAEVPNPDGSLRAGMQGMLDLSPFLDKAEGSRP